jgi:hypothetical protein
MDMRLVGLQSRSVRGEEKNSLSLPGIEPQSPCMIDQAIPAPKVGGYVIIFNSKLSDLFRVKYYHDNIEDIRGCI